MVSPIRWSGLAILVLSIGGAQSLQAKSPEWLRELAAAPLPPHDEHTPAVLMYSETLLTVLPDGQMKRRVREAFRILRPDGEARGVVRVDTNAWSRVLDMKGWNVPASGAEYEARFRDASESAVIGVDGGELISDVRSRLLAIPGVKPGSLIGYEYETSENPLGLADQWWFQDNVPLRESRYALQLPPGWNPEIEWINHPPVTAAQPAPGRWEWVVRNLPAVKAESRMPPWDGVAGRVFVALKPPAGAALALHSWDEIGIWYEGLAKDRKQVTPEISRRVKELVAGKTTTLEKVAALAAFVQSDIRYVAIELGIGGYQPHSAASVLTNRFGDCKDKATLLAVMLAEIGVPAHYVIVNTLRGTVSASSPANLGFDHVILAISLPDGGQGDRLLARGTHGKLGSLLYFDPTDDVVPLGRLSGNLQGGHGLLVTPDGGDLVQLPAIVHTESGIQRLANLTLDASGKLVGDVSEVLRGDFAAGQRARIRAVDAETDIVKPLEASLNRSFGTFRIQKASMRNRRNMALPFELNYSIEVEGYARQAGDLLLVRPRVLGSKYDALLEGREARVHDIVLEELRTDSDEFTIKLPDNLIVDSLPAPVEVDYGFAAYRSRTELVGNALRYTRTYEIKALTVPVARADEFRQLHRIIDRDERAQVVLKQKAK